MEKIASFTVNHLTLRPGVYVSRKDHVGAEVVTTFDLRMTAPNLERYSIPLKFTPLSILALLISAITRSTKIRPSTLDRWDAALDSI